MSYLPLENETNYRFNQLLKEAEEYRLFKRVAAKRPDFQVRTLQSLGDTLISLGKSLKTLSLSL